MPGRLALYDDTAFKADAQSLITTFHDRIGTLKPSYNTPPTKPVATLLNTGEYLQTHFGLIPSWAKDTSAMQINARSENLFERVTFTESFRTRRCLIPVNGWFEWKVDDQTKQPYYVHPKKHNYFALAGVWDLWQDPKTGRAFPGSAIITCEPNATIQTVHHRMPVILPQEHWQLWLNSNSDIGEVYKLLVPYDSDDIAIRTVSQSVNSVENNGPECIALSEAKPAGQGSLF